MTEIWKTVPGFPEFEASSKGFVRKVSTGRNGRRPHILRGYVNAKGYKVSGFQSGHRRYNEFGHHRFVCLAFHGPQPSELHQVAHFDGDRLNNTPDNLRWATAKENADDRARHGNNLCGERHAMHKITSENVAEVKRLCARGCKQRDVASMFGIHQAQVHRIVTGKSWSKVLL